MSDQLQYWRQSEVASDAAPNARTRSLHSEVEMRGDGLVSGLLSSLRVLISSPVVTIAPSISDWASTSGSTVLSLSGRVTTSKVDLIAAEVSCDRVSSAFDVLSMGRGAS